MAYLLSNNSWVFPLRACAQTLHPTSSVVGDDDETYAGLCAEESSSQS